MNRPTFHNQATALSLPPPTEGDSTHYKHADEPGFYVRVHKPTASGEVRRAWVARYSVESRDGKLQDKKQVLGLVGATGYEEAVVKCRGLLRGARVARETGHRAMPTLRQAFDEVLRFKVEETERGLRPRTLAEYQARFRTLISEEMADTPLSELTWVRWSAWRALITSERRIAAEGKNPVGKLRVDTFLSSAVSAIYSYWGRQFPGLPNPITELRLQGVLVDRRSEAHSYLDPEVLPAFFKGLDFVAPAGRDVALIELMTGWREGLVYRIALDRIDRTEQAVLWKPSDQGGPYYEPFLYPVGDWLWRQVFLPRLELARPGQRYLFPGRGGKSGHYTGATNAWKPLEKQIGLHFTDHTLRNTFATIAASDPAVSPFQLTHLLMHEGTSRSLAAAGMALTPMTLRYAKKDTALMRQSLNQIQTTILRLAGKLAPPASAKAGALTEEDTALLKQLLAKLNGSV